MPDSVFALGLEQHPNHIWVKSLGNTLAGHRQILGNSQALTGEVSFILELILGKICDGNKGLSIHKDAPALTCE